ncbi:MAG: CHAD domain-containing protein [Steroidobacteraceae bacterium]
MITTSGTTATRVDAGGTRRLRRAVRALQFELAAVMARLGRARPDDLHRARVLARRLRALVGAYAPYFDPIGARRARAALQRLARAVDACREADVRIALLNGITSTRGSPSTGRRFGPWLARERAGLARALAAGLVTNDPRPELRAALDALRVAEDVPVAGLLERLRRERRRLRRLERARGGRRALHRLRLAVKRLRYAIAPLEDLAPDEARWLLARLRAAQVHLGERHDALLAIEWLRTHPGVLGRGVAGEITRRLEARARESRRDGRAAVAHVGAAWKAWRRATRDLRAVPSGH